MVDWLQAHSDDILIGIVSGLIFQIVMQIWLKIYKNVASISHESLKFFSRQYTRKMANSAGDKIAVTKNMAAFLTLWDSALPDLLFCSMFSTGFIVRFMLSPDSPATKGDIVYLSFNLALLVLWFLLRSPKKQTL